MNRKEKGYEWVDSESWKAYGIAILLILLPFVVHIVLKIS